MAARFFRTAAARAAHASAPRPTRSRRLRPSFGFGKDRRLRKRSEFLRVQAEGRRATSASFVFLVMPGPEPEAPSRLGLVTTKKVGNAVVRNRMRRLCREAFRLTPDYVPAGTWLVVIVRAALEGIGLEAVQGEWRKARPKVLTALQSFAKGPGAQAAAGALAATKRV